MVGKGKPEGVTCYVEPAHVFRMRTGTLVARTLTIPHDNTCNVRMINPHDEPVRLWRGMTLGILKQAEQTRVFEDPAPTSARISPVVSQRDTQQLQIQRDMDTVGDKKKPVSNQLPEHLAELFSRSITELNIPQRKQLHNILSAYRDVFATDSNDIGLTSWVKHDVDTGDEPPVRQRPRRLRYEQRPILEKTIADLHQQGRIRPSHSEWASNVVLVKKKQTDMTKPAEWRMCIDYRELNLKTKNPDSYMLPRIDDTLDSLSRAKFFCTLDIQQGYHNVELSERAKEKSAFHVPCVNPPHWEWIYMPFGLVGAPRTF